MHGMGKTVTELHAMLKLHEQTLPKKDDAHALHAIRTGKVRKKNHKNKKPQLAARGNNHGKGKSKLAYAPKPKIPPPPKKYNPAKDGLKGSRKLKPGALSLYVGDSHRAAVEAIGSYHLCLPYSAHLIVLRFSYKLHNYQDKDCRGRLLSSFQDDEHVGQDARSQDGNDDKEKQGERFKDLGSKDKVVEWVVLEGCIVGVNGVRMGGGGISGFAIDSSDDKNRFGDRKSSSYGLLLLSTLEGSLFMIYVDARIQYP
ncbi:hypothetical protein Tco_0549077 [Tanacetum coccineum]